MPLTKRGAILYIYAYGSQELAQVFHKVCRVDHCARKILLLGKNIEPFFKNAVATIAGSTLFYTMVYSLDLRVKRKSISNDIEISSPSFLFFRSLFSFLQNEQLNSVVKTGTINHSYVGFAKKRQIIKQLNLDFRYVMVVIKQKRHNAP